MFQCRRVGLGECGHSRSPKYDQRQPHFQLPTPHRSVVTIHRFGEHENAGFGRCGWFASDLNARPAVAPVAVLTGLTRPFSGRLSSISNCFGINAISKIAHAIRDCLPISAQVSAKSLRNAAESRSRAPFCLARPGLSALKRVDGLGFGLPSGILIIRKLEKASASPRPFPTGHYRICSR